MSDAARSPSRRDPFAPVDAASTGAFRIGFGVLLLVEVSRFVHSGWITSEYVAPRFHFAWPGLEWVRPWPGAGMHVHFLVLAVAAAGLAAGVWYRTCAIVTFVGWTYVFLLDRALYLNHAYLISLIALLLTFIPANRALRMDGGRGDGNRPTTIPRWCLWLLRVQIGIPYVYGGLAKLNGDFTQGFPLVMWMSRMEHLDWVPGLGTPAVAVAAAWLATVFDLLVVPALLWRRTRTIALVAAVAFHLANAVMWRIGVFPWMMIAATTLFLPPDWPRRFTGHPVEPSRADTPALFGGRRRVVAVLVGMWLVVQMLVPFRHLLVPGWVDWTMEGYYFSWRMMLNDRAAAVRIVVEEPGTGRRTTVDPRDHGLTRTQWNKLGQHPDLLWQFCQHLASEQRERGAEVEVRATVLCALNGRRPQYLVDPTVDLARAPRHGADGHATWLVPLVEPLPATPWLEPQRTWEREVGPWSEWSDRHLRADAGDGLEQ